LYKRQGLSSDDIIFAVYSMAEVDFQGFFSTFLPQYIQSLEGVSAGGCQVLARHFDANNDRVSDFNILSQLLNFTILVLLERFFFGLYDGYQNVVLLP